MCLFNERVRENLFAYSCPNPYEYSPVFYKGDNLIYKANNLIYKANNFIYKGDNFVYKYWALNCRVAAKNCSRFW